jgi:hypothetical protein
MGRQGIFRHQLPGNLPRQDLIDTTLDVDFGKLIKLKLGILAQLLAFAREVRLLGVGLRPDGHILAGGHRHGASHQSCDARDQDVVLRRGPLRQRRRSSLLSRRYHRLPRAPPLSTTQCGRRDGSPGAGEDGSSDIPPLRSDAPKQHENDNDNQDGAEDANAAVTVAVAVAAKAATEATEQENDK